MEVILLSPAGVSGGPRHRNADIPANDMPFSYQIEKQYIVFPYYRIMYAIDTYGVR